jgi:FkbM family methyltransferase
MNKAMYYLSLRGLGVLNSENEDATGERYLIREYLPGKVKSSHPVFFDVGAHEGTVTAELLGAFPNALVYAFEPHPETFLRLKSAGFPPDRVQYNNLAVGSKPGKAILFDRADQEGSEHASIHEEVISDIHHQNATAREVSLDTLDNIAKARGVTYIDYLKSDTEGNDLAVLQGASELLLTGRIGLIQFEFSEINIVSRVFMRDFRKVLAGYEFYRLLPRGLLPLGSGVVATEIFGYQNIVAVPSRR